ncbi:MAG: RbsD/FucU family protein [Planctomycetota bacterium]
MLKTQLTHPQILEGLARAGHGSKVLIADGNYPSATTLGANARLVHLNLAPGTVSATDVLDALITAIPIEAAAVMETQKTGPYAMTEDPEIWGEFSKALEASGQSGALERVERFEFYERAARPDVSLTIATGEQRIYANLLLTIGVVQ